MPQPTVPDYTVHYSAEKWPIDKWIAHFCIKNTSYSIHYLSLPHATSRETKEVEAAHAVATQANDPSHLSQQDITDNQPATREVSPSTSVTMLVHATSTSTSDTPSPRNSPYENADSMNVADTTPQELAPTETDAYLA